MVFLHGPLYTNADAAHQNKFKYIHCLPVFCLETLTNLPCGKKMRVVACLGIFPCVSSLSLSFSLSPSLSLSLFTFFLAPAVGFALIGTCQRRQLVISLRV
jgi:hypothetical protein